MSPTPDDISHRGHLRGLGEQLMRMDAENQQTRLDTWDGPPLHQSSWFHTSALRSFLRAVDPDLNSVLTPYGDATLLETHGERFLELVVTKAPCAEWSDWLSTSLQVAARADNVDVFQRLFALCVHDAEFWACSRPASLLATCGTFGSVGVLEFLLSFDIFVTATQEVCEGIADPAIVEAAAFCHRSCVSALIKAGAYLEQANAEFETALNCAVHHGGEDVVLDLLAAGADVNDTGGIPPTVDGEIVMNPTALHIAADHPRVRYRERMVDILLAAGADHSRRSCSPVTTAARKGHCGVLERLFSAGADPNVVDMAWGRTTPLSWASYYGHEGAVELLLRHNASVTMRCDQGRLPCDVVLVGVLEKRSTRGRREHPSTLNAAEESAADRIHNMLKRASGWARRGWLVMMRARRLMAAQLVDESSVAKPSPVEEPATRHGDETQDDGGDIRRTAGTPGVVKHEGERTAAVSTETLILLDGGHDEAKQPGGGGGWERAVDWVLQCPDEHGVFREILSFL